MWKKLILRSCTEKPPKYYFTRFDGSTHGDGEGRDTIVNNQLDVGRMT